MVDLKLNEIMVAKSKFNNKVYELSERLNQVMTDRTPDFEKIVKSEIPGFVDLWGNRESNEDMIYVNSKYAWMWRPGQDVILDYSSHDVPLLSPKDVVKQGGYLEAYYAITNVQNYVDVYIKGLKELTDSLD
ncbi:hypothetical protein [Secundilactobacillus kimchicus]|uniref:hypothetical protein n=1 Tax=Secundilactobacillus kimchicus TaxID=528209 RepID=UPI0024A8F61C|nr:hypothetical protein [Secundilactobacillus kimchicus]